MRNPGKRWTIQDRYGNLVYLTEERWHHIVDHMNPPEMADFEWHLKRTIRTGTRRQELLNPGKYRYTQSFQDLPGESTNIVAIVVFGFTMDKNQQVSPNNYIATAFLKHIRSKRL